MKTVCKTNMCAGCMACADICPVKAINLKDDLFACNAVIDENRCIDCKACYRVCPNNQFEKLQLPKEWYQGWAQDKAAREKSSSGGLATAIAEGFIDNGGVVCACTFRSGRFGFEFAQTREEVQKFIGSKYVKSNPSGVYRAVQEKLRQGKKVLFIGLPCQVSAMRNVAGRKYQDNLYTCDLICHGTPSPQMLEMFLQQYGKSLSDFQSIQFRKKANFMISGDGQSIITNGVSDRYSIAFLNALIYTENCYSCPYAGKGRISDLTLGDAWGSELPQKEQKKGISLILCQSKKGTELLDQGRIHLEQVDLSRAIANNHQLEHPSEKPKKRAAFFGRIGRQTFNCLVFQYLPKQCIRQDIKRILIQTKILKR